MSEVIERSWKAPIELVWELWTTPEGIASWWGPRGFRVEVHGIEPEVGGEFHYTMHAGTPEMAANLESAGRPASFSVVATIVEVEEHRVLSWESPFGPERLTMRAEFTADGDTVALRMTLSGSKPGMTGGAAGGWRSALDKLGEHLAQ